MSITGARRRKRSRRRNCRKFAASAGASIRSLYRPRGGDKVTWKLQRIGQCPQLAARLRPSAFVLAWRLPGIGRAAHVATPPDPRPAAASVWQHRTASQHLPVPAAQALADAVTRARITSTQILNFPCLYHSEQKDWLSLFCSTFSLDSTEKTVRKRTQDAKRRRARNGVACAHSFLLCSNSVDVGQDLASERFPY